MQPDIRLLEGEEQPPCTPEERFSEFFKQHYWLVLAFAQRRINSHETARDLTSETFRVAWDKFGDTDHMGLAFLYQTCKNLIGNEYRRQLRVAALEVKLQHHPERSEGDAHSIQLREAMLKMRDAEREILYLTYWEELSAQQLANVLDCSQEAAWARVSRARKSLKHILRNGGHHA